jgi:hypothetical protein
MLRATGWDFAVATAIVLSVIIFEFVTRQAAALFDTQTIELKPFEYMHFGIGIANYSLLGLRSFLRVLRAPL